MHALGTKIKLGLPVMCTKKYQGYQHSLHYIGPAYFHVVLVFRASGLDYF